MRSEEKELIEEIVYCPGGATSDACNDDPLPSLRHAVVCGLNSPDRDSVFPVLPKSRHQFLHICLVPRRQQSRHVLKEKGLRLQLPHEVRHEAQQISFIVCTHREPCL
jgi:hypothetical protein